MTVVCGRLLGCLLLVAAGCAEAPTSLVVQLVPNPEVNTRADVIALVNSLEITLDAQEGFAGLEALEGETWGPYDVIDVDGDGALELVLIRPGGQRALDPFALTQGSQAERVIDLSVRGRDTSGRLTSLGGGAVSFRPDEQLEVELPFNLTPEYRPLRVISMTPAQGSQDLEPPVEGVALILSGEVLQSALTGHVTVVDVDSGARHQPQPVPSTIVTAMGLLTNVRLPDCTLWGGRFEVIVDAGEVCTTSRQCLDQHLGLEGAQPFEGAFTVRGDPDPSSCQPALTPESVSCPELPCEPGFGCEDGLCVLYPDALPMGSESETALLCDSGLCAPPELLCGEDGLCRADCRFYGACPEAADRCDQATGLCGE